MPLTVDEYQVGQMYAFSVESLNNTGGGDGLEVVRIESFKNVRLPGKKKPLSGQYTYKIYHMASKAPAFIRMLMPKGTLEFHEESWNAYPYCKTVITNPKFMKENFQFVIESIHLPGGPDRDNALGIPDELLKVREIVDIDIANDRISSGDYSADMDPTLFHSAKNGRGPLSRNWKKTANPLMTCYKLVTAEFKWFGLQTRVENSMLNTERRIFHLFHRQIFCLSDEWHGMSLEEVRDFEAKIKYELDKARSQGEPRGFVASE